MNSQFSAVHYSAAPLTSPIVPYPQACVTHCQVPLRGPNGSIPPSAIQSRPGTNANIKNLSTSTSTQNRQPSKARLASTTAATDSKSAREPPNCPSANRGILIQNLDHRVTWRLLKDKLSKVGNVTRCDVTPEKTSSAGHSAVSSTGSKKPPRQAGMAIFASREMAIKAVRYFDGYELLGRKMRVKLNDEKAAGVSGPGNLDRYASTASALQSGEESGTNSAVTRRGATKQAVKKNGSHPAGTMSEGSETAGAADMLTHLRVDDIKLPKRSDSPLVIDGSAASKRYAAPGRDHDHNNPLHRGRTQHYIDDSDADDDDTENEAEEHGSSDDHDGDAVDRRDRSRSRTSSSSYCNHSSSHSEDCDGGEGTNDEEEGEIDETSKSSLRLFSHSMLSFPVVPLLLNSCS